jgi:hypothetical protein
LQLAGPVRQFIALSENEEFSNVNWFISVLENFSTASYLSAFQNGEARMKLKKREREFLQIFVHIAQRLLSDTGSSKSNGHAKRSRRSAKDAAALKKQVRAARRQNMPVKQIAEELGVTPSYVYQLQR